MANGAELTVVGNLVRFELKFSSSGKAWGNGAVAVSEFTNTNGERKESTTFLDFKVFGDLAENLAESADKGTRIMVVGKLRNEQWTASDGTERRSMTLYVDEIGASLRWAQAKVTKTNKGGGQSAGRPAPSSAPAADSGFDAGGDDNPFL